jgi:long-chain acyl-CoA synthetase
MDGWDAEEALRIMAEHGVTHTHLVPTMMHRLLQLPEATRARHNIRSVRWVLHGAAPCPVHLKHAFIEWFGPVIYEYYSSTEGAGTFITPQEWLERPGSVGKPIDGVTLQVADEQARALPAGQEGLIYTAVPETGRFEYYKDDSKTQGTYVGDWFTLGDVGRFDRDGYLFLTGRVAELIISGGVNIYPSEIDHVLVRHPAIADVAVVGVPNDEWGEEIKAVVELKPGEEPNDNTRASILEFAKSALPSFQRPRTVDFVATLPRNAAGKVLRGQIRAAYWQGREKAI